VSTRLARGKIKSKHYQHRQHYRHKQLTMVTTDSRN